MNYTLLSDYNVGTKENVILKNISGQLRDRRLTALLGPSGAGKSSLLNILSGFKEIGVTGTVLVNGQERVSKSYRKLSAYIPQNFPFLENITTKATFQFAADLRLPRSHTRQEKQDIIDNVVEVLNLTKCLNTLVSKLSGGEKKRLSIGVELLTNPKIMFFDEPTSGLDSYSSFQVMTYLRKLAHGGRIICCVIHSPSSQLLKLFDDIMLMANGQILYCGQESEMLEYLHSKGHKCPEFYNPADFALELAFKSEKEIQLPPYEMKIEPNIFEELNMEPSAEKRLSTYANNDFFQLLTLVRRNFECMKRDYVSVYIRITIQLAVAVVFGLTMPDIGIYADHVHTNICFVFLTLFFLYFVNAFATLLVYPTENEVFMREYKSCYYSLKSYYFAKIVTDIPLLIIAPSMYLVPAYVLTSQPWQLDRFAMYMTFGLLTSFIGQVVGLVFASLLAVQTAVFVIPGLSFPLFLYSGFFLPRHMLPAFFQPVERISIFRYLFHGYTEALYGYGREPMECLGIFCPFRSLDYLFEQMSINDYEFALNFGVSLLVLFGLYLLFFIILCFKVKFNK